MAVQYSYYAPDGSTRTFPSTKHIASKQHMAVWYRRISDGVWVVQNVSTYELINNTAVLVEAPDVALYDNIEIRVADTYDELTDSPSAIAIVAGLATEIVTLTTEPVITYLATSGANATAAKLEAWNAMAERLTADSYATEASGVFVKIYTSNDDGTFTATPTTEYSALHYSIVSSGDKVANVPNYVALQAIDVSIVTKVNLTELHPGISESGGPFTWNPSADKATANPGTRIDPTVSLALQGSGVGIGCWEREDMSVIKLPMFGLIDDDLTDNGIGITYINTYLADNVKRVAAGLGAPFLQTYVTKLIISGGIYKTSVALTLPPGCEVEFNGGAVLKAYANDQDILVSTTPAWNTANLSLYSARSVKVSGTGVIDGDNKASRGMVLDTVATGSSFENISIMRCTKSRYVTTGAGTLGTTTLTIASGTAKVGDVITIAGEVDGPTDTYFRVIGVAGTVLTLSGNLTITHTTSVVTHFAVGLTCMMVQQSVINVTTYGNSIGSVFMKNIDGFNCTDITFVGGGNENNKYAGAIFANIRGSKFYGTRYQHTTDGPEIISYGSVGNKFYNIYVESASDAEIASDSSLTLAQMQAIPMIYISSSSSSNDMVIRWPNNPGNTTWRRLIHNKGGSIEVSITTQVGALNPNPLLGTDYAPILQDSATGQIYLNGFYGQTTLLTADKTIIDETSTYMPPNRSFARLRTNARETSAGGSSRAYGLNTATNIQEHYVYGDTQPRLQILTTELRLGSGSATPDVRLSRAAADTFGIGAGDSIRLPDVTNGGGAGGNTATTLQMTDANGVVYHLWVDTAGKLRIHTSKNVVENTAGVVVGTQA